MNSQELEIEELRSRQKSLELETQEIRRRLVDAGNAPKGNPWGM